MNQSINSFSSLIPHPLLGLFMIRVLSTATAILAEFQALWRRLLILRRNVVATFASLTLEHNVIARHSSKTPQLFNEL